LQNVERTGAVIIYRLPPVGRAHYKKWGLLFTSVPALFKRRRQWDVILVSGFRVIGIAALLISKVCGKVCILKADSLGEMSGDFFADGLAKLHLRPTSVPFRIFLSLRNRILRGAHAFVAISSDVASELQRHGVPLHMIHTIPNSVDVRMFHPVEHHQKRALRHMLGPPQQDRIVAFSGRLVSYKGLPLLLRVWRELQRKHAHTSLLLVGAGGLDIHNCEEELRAYVQANGLAHSVYFAGAVQNVHAYLQAADVFVLPTENEAFGIALIEAMACGLPVIATPVGGGKDILKHQHNGLVVEAGEFQQLYDALNQLLAYSTDSRRLGQAACQTVQNCYATETILKAYIQLFRRVVGGC
jgi:glycosyltransferase involved in cell wall biosynthesis